MNGPKEECLSCGEMIFISKLRNHVINCRNINEAAKSLQSAAVAGSEIPGIVDKANQNMLGAEDYKKCITEMDLSAYNIKQITSRCSQVTDHSNNLVEKLTELWASGTLCDVTLCVEGQKFKAHRLVLHINSPYFAQELETCSENDMTLNYSCSAVAMETVLSFMYTGMITVKPESIGEVYKLSKKLQMPSLEHLCSTSIYINRFLFTDSGIDDNAKQTVNENMNQKLESENASKDRRKIKLPRKNKVGSKYQRIQTQGKTTRHDEKSENISSDTEMNIKTRLRNTSQVKCSIFETTMNQEVHMKDDVELGSTPQEKSSFSTLKRTLKSDGNTKVDTESGEVRKKYKLGNKLLGKNTEGSKTQPVEDPRKSVFHYACLESDSDLNQELIDTEEYQFADIIQDDGENSKKEPKQRLREKLGRRNVTENTQYGSNNDKTADDLSTNMMIVDGFPFSSKDVFPFVLENNCENGLALCNICHQQFESTLAGFGHVLKEHFKVLSDLIKTMHGERNMSDRIFVTCNFCDAQLLSLNHCFVHTQVYHGDHCHALISKLAQQLKDKEDVAIVRKNDKMDSTAKGDCGIIENNGRKGIIENNDRKEKEDVVLSSQELEIILNKCCEGIKNDRKGIIENNDRKEKEDVVLSSQELEIILNKCCEDIKNDKKMTVVIGIAVKFSRRLEKLLKNKNLGKAIKLAGDKQYLGLFITNSFTQRPYFYTDYRSNCKYECLICKLHFTPKHFLQHLRKKHIDILACVWLEQKLNVNVCIRHLEIDSLDNITDMLMKEFVDIDTTLRTALDVHMEKVCRQESNITLQLKPIPSKLSNCENKYVESVSQKHSSSVLPVFHSDSTCRYPSSHGDHHKINDKRTVVVSCKEADRSYGSSLGAKKTALLQSCKEIQSSNVDSLGDKSERTPSLNEHGSETYFQDEHMSPDTDDHDGNCGIKQEELYPSSNVMEDTSFIISCENVEGNSEEDEGEMMTSFHDSSETLDEAHPRKYGESHYDSEGVDAMMKTEPYESHYVLSMENIKTEPLDYPEYETDCTFEVFDDTRTKIKHEPND